MFILKTGRKELRRIRIQLSKRLQVKLQNVDANVLL